MMKGFILITVLFLLEIHSFKAYDSGIIRIDSGLTAAQFAHSFGIHSGGSIRPGTRDSGTNAGNIKGEDQAKDKLRPRYWNGNTIVYPSYLKINKTTTVSPTSQRKNRTRTTTTEPPIPHEYDDDDPDDRRVMKEDDKTETGKEVGIGTAIFVLFLLAVIGASKLYDAYTRHHNIPDDDVVPVMISIPEPEVNVRSVSREVFHQPQHNPYYPQPKPPSSSSKPFKYPKGRTIHAPPENYNRFQRP